MGLGPWVELAAGLAARADEVATWGWRMLAQALEARSTRGAGARRPVSLEAGEAEVGTGEAEELRRGRGGGDGEGLGGARDRGNRLDPRTWRWWKATAWRLASTASTVA